MKRNVQLYLIAGITGAIVGTSSLAVASQGGEYSADSYDLALLSSPISGSPASMLPADFELASFETEIDPGTLRLVATEGQSAIFVAFNTSGELCLIDSIDVSADEWVVGLGCTDPESFNERGASTRMTSPTDSVEAYLLPDSAVATLRENGHDLGSVDSPNVVFIDAYETGDERARVSEALQEVGVKVDPQGESDENQG